MKFRILFSLFFLIAVMCVSAQNIYTLSGGEVIFQSALIESNHDAVNTNMRFTLFFHFGEFIHLDMGNNVGIFSGIGLRNVGFITDENDVKIKYRTYNLGIPLAIKLGSFKKNTYIFAGGEYEWMMHFKQKVFENEEKTKYTKWFSSRTPAFIPSVFGGIQFPKGFQVKMRYYLDNYLNHKYVGTTSYSDYTSFNKTQVWYISFSYLIRNNRIKEARPISTEMAKL